MYSIFSLKDTCDIDEQINLDELYEKKQQHDINTLNTFNKVLNRIHNKIKITSRQNLDGQFCWFLVPETIIGVPKYDHNNCIVYIINKLKENGFIVKYTNPNLLFISWKHWVPTYVRNEIKKNTGVIVDGWGNKLDESTQNKRNEHTTIESINNNMLLNISKIGDNKIAKEYKNTKTYEPTGNFIYSKNMFKQVEDKLA